MSFSKRCLEILVLTLALNAPAMLWAQTAPSPKLLDAAKKEGALVYYTTMTLDQSRSVADRFEKKYGIKVTV
ncbi:MAG TPA: ABC transporter substrate-binding protein, partial [Candidatus Binatia bacterium]|nr:ABC transporter substrate-binding protein [Candidatus Binatia bacterium]